MRMLSQLFENNRAWAAETTRQDPDFFKRLARQQEPGYLWIGCSDSRVPANQIVGLVPGDMFVHRNVANGGVLAARRDDKLGLVDNWLRHVQDVKAKHRAQLDALETEAQRHATLCELNVVEQVINVSRTSIVRDAWQRGQEVAVHGWIYDIRDGLLWDIGVTVAAESEIPDRVSLPARGANP